MQVSTKDDDDMEQPTDKTMFEVLAHTDDVLIIQTNAGISLTSSADTLQLNSNSQSDSGDAVVREQSGFGRFNIALHVNDDAKTVLDNRAQLLRKINQYIETKNVNPQNLQPKVTSIHWLNQTHSNTVFEVKQDNLTLKAPNADAQITQSKHQALAVMTADCVPIVLFDDSSKYIAAIHAGWQGLVNGVIAETVSALKNKVTNLNKSPQSPSITAWIGASISQDCYEVSKSLAEDIVNSCVKLEQSGTDIRKLIVKAHNNPDKAWLDLPALAKLQLKMNHIDVEISHYACSYEQSNYYSYRRKTHLQQTNMGRMALLIVRLR